MRDILRACEAIERAEALLARDPDDADLNAAVVAAWQFHVLTIGEAVKALPPGVTSKRPEVPWSDIARMRDLIGHHYYRLDPEIVRATIGAPLAELRTACADMLTALDRA